MFALQYEIAKMAALLHRAADMAHVPAMKETKFLLPKPALTVRDIKPAQWVNMVQSSWVEVQGLETIQAKAQVLGMYPTCHPQPAAIPQLRPASGQPATVGQGSLAPASVTHAPIVRPWASPSTHAIT